MALPVFRSAGASSVGTTGAVTVAAPTGIVEGDLEILLSGTIAGGTVSITTNGGGAWTAMTSLPQDVTGGEKLYGWWRIRASGDSSPAVTPGSDHSISMRLCYVGGTFDPADPFENEVPGSEVTSDTSFSFAPGGSTSVNDSLVLCVATSGVDSNTAQVPVMTNASLTALASRFNGNTLSGGGGGFGVTEGAKATAGTVGTFANTYAGASPKAYYSFVIKPYVPSTAYPNNTTTWDDFNRADNASLGANWLENAFGVADVVSLASNRIGATATAAIAWVGSTCPADGDWYIEVPVLPNAGNRILLDIRTVNHTVSTWNGYQFFFIPSTGSWQINRVASGTGTTIRSGTLTGFAAGDAVGCRATGTYLEMYIRKAGTWNFVGSVYDPTYAAAGPVGLVLWDSTVRYDNFVGPVVALVAAPTGLGTAQSFGSVTPVPGGVATAMSGLSSAAAFGAIKANIAFTIGGLSSAGAFGIPVASPGGVAVALSGVPSPQGFGTLQGNIAFTTGGLSSAQAFGAPSVSTTGGGLSASPAGLSSAQAFGAVTPSPGGVVAPVSGVGSAQAFGAVQENFSFAVAGVSTAQSFGTVGILTGGTVIPVTGLGSAQAFSTPGVTTPGGDTFNPAVHGNRKRMRHGRRR